MSILAILFHVDQLSIIMMMLVGFVGLSVAFFSYRYLRGDSNYVKFYLTLIGLLTSVFVMVNADHLLLFLASWGLSNFLLVLLMIHKSSWRAAYESGVLAGKNFLFGFMMITAAFALLYKSAEQTSIQNIIHSNSVEILPAILLFIGAMTQSALWPFHRWLISTLNSPTPVSALMHAGLVNGGGFLLCRFAPLYTDLPNVMTVIFVLGFSTAMIGTLWKLMQSDVKRMLACSTMGQMGFMIMQCGLGLFPAAIIHLCCHGLFKAYLFLASGGVAQEKSLDLGYPPKISVFILSLVCGVFACFFFTLMSHKEMFPKDTSFFLIFIVFMTCSQFAMPLLRSKRFLLAFIVTPFMGGLYGFGVFILEKGMGAMDFMHPQPLNIVHILGLTIFLGSWLLMLFYRPFKKMPNWILKIYVRMLNASQPHPKTVTTHRNHYQYL